MKNTKITVDAISQKEHEQTLSALQKHIVQEGASTIEYCYNEFKQLFSIRFTIEEKTFEIKINISFATESILKDNPDHARYKAMVQGTRLVWKNLCNILVGQMVLLDLGQKQFAFNPFLISSEKVTEEDKEEGVKEEGKIKKTTVKTVVNGK